MAGKKAKGSKATDDKGTRPGGSNTSQDQKETIDYLQLKITDLTEKLSRSVQKTEILTSENLGLSKELATFTADGKDIVEYLLIKIRENEEMITNLETKILKGEQDRVNDEKDYQSQIKVVNEANTAKVENLLVEILALKRELAEVSRFSTEKEDLYNQLKSTKALLERKEIEYREAVHGLERKVLHDKTQMKKEMLQKVNEAVANFRKVADQQMAETTKRSIRENMSISVQLKKMSQKTVQFIKENDILKQKLSALKLQNSLLAESEKELARKSISYQKTVKMMYQKLKESDQILELAFEENALIHEQVDNMQPIVELGQSTEMLTEEMKAEIANLQDDYNQLVERMTAVGTLSLDLEYLLRQTGEALDNSTESTDIVEYIEESLTVIIKRLTTLTDFDGSFYGADVPPDDNVMATAFKETDFGEHPEVSRDVYPEVEFEESSKNVKNDSQIVYRSFEELQDYESSDDFGNSHSQSVQVSEEGRNSMVEQQSIGIDFSISNDADSLCTSMTSSQNVQIERLMTPRKQQLINPHKQKIEDTLKRIVQGSRPKTTAPLSIHKHSQKKKNAGVQTTGIVFAQKIDADYLLKWDYKTTTPSRKITAPYNTNKKTIARPGIRTSPKTDLPKLNTIKLPTK